MGGMNYMAGKVGHIYRIKAIDANGDWTWGKQNIDVGKKLHTIELPQDWLDKAAYPVVVDPTFGYTTLGSLSESHSINDAVGSNINKTASTNASVDSISVGTVGSGINLKGFIVRSLYLDILSNGITPSGISVSENWLTLNYATKPTVVLDVSYSPYIVFGGTVNIYYDNGSSNDSRTESDNNYNSPTNPSYLTGSSKRFSIYATYTASGGAARRVIITE
jgi:hypothetical protein